MQRLALPPVRAPGHLGREVLVAAALAAATAALVALLPIPGGDAAAHLYRAHLVRHGILVWDNLWFSGDYPLLSYSLLYYPPAALVGNLAMATASVVVAAMLFASILGRRWGAAARWPSRSFAVLVTGQLFTAAYPFDAGTAAMLASVWALQRRRYVLAGVAAVLTVGFSPLAFFFLVLTVVALFLYDRRVTRGVVAYAALLGVLGGGQLALAAIVGAARLVYPFGVWRFVGGVAIALAGLLLARRHRAGPLPLLFAVWVAAVVVLFVVPTTIGHNALRASVFLFPLMLLAGRLRRFRPPLLTAATLLAALGVVTVPYLSMIDARASDPLASRAGWSGALEFLRRHETPDYRVEVVPTANHWEAYFVAGAGYPIARGWYRQLDLADNRAVYAAGLTGAGYRRWLRSEGVRFVVLPHDPLEAIDGAREAALLRSGRAGLRRVWRGANVTVFELPRPTPLVTGPGRAEVTALDSDRIVGTVSRPGSYLLRVHFTTDWRASPSGSVCVADTADAMTRLTVRRAGRFVLGASESPEVFLDRLLDAPARCTG